MTWICSCMAHVIVPILFVPGQHYNLILGSNVIKHVMKGVDDYWNIASKTSP